MDGLVLSHDAIRVAADAEEVLPGFLFAFLSSRDAQAMIRQRTYGSVVQHIEPHHLADLPVPLLDDRTQRDIHGLVEQAASARSVATRLLDEAAAHFDSLAGAMPSPHHHSRALGSIRRRRLSDRLDAFHHIGWAAEPSSAGTTLSQIASVWSVSSMKRIFAPNGVPFATGTNIFDVRPRPENRLARWAVDEVHAAVQEGDILVQAYGQLNGLIGRPAYVGKRSDGWAAGHLLFRIRPSNTASLGQIFAFLRSDSGRRALLRFASGNQIPHLIPNALRQLQIPALPDEISGSTIKALELREKADRDEQRAVEEVEAWLA
jgi:type I restriction enzyme S subunit